MKNLINSKKLRCLVYCIFAIIALHLIFSITFLHMNFRVDSILSQPRPEGPRSVEVDHQHPLLHESSDASADYRRHDTFGMKSDGSDGKIVDGHDVSDHSFDHIAIALKTGRDIAVERIPIQLLTFLAPVKNVMIIGEASGVVIGPHKMVDVYTGLYKSLGFPDPLEKELSKHVGHDKLDRSRGNPFDDGIVPNHSSVGWKADAHKNLPGFRELMRKFPGASWYMMIDDDTYIFMDNLKEFLKGFDPLKPYYLGRANNFKFCDGVEAFGEGPFFAHGGSGIVISRGAMLKMISGVETCMIRYKDCWAGDVRTSLCLRDHNITLINSRLFNTNPPNKKYAFIDNPCNRPTTFHHLHVHQIQRLATLEQRKKSQGKHVRLADIFHDWMQSGFDPEFDADRPGTDISYQTAKSATECHDRCSLNKKCMSYTFDKRLCWLKSGIPATQVRAGYVSGIIASHYTCSLD